MKYHQQASVPFFTGDAWFVLGNLPRAHFRSAVIFLGVPHSLRQSFIYDTLFYLPAFKLMALADFSSLSWKFTHSGRSILSKLRGGKTETSLVPLNLPEVLGFASAFKLKRVYPGL